VTTDDRELTAQSTCAALTIQQASTLMTVPVSTLRSWEQRYDIPRTSRTSGGHRRYTTTAIDEVRLMRDEIARGKRAGEAAVSARLLLEPPGPARRLVDMFLDAAQAMDPGRVRACLNEAADQLGLNASVDEVLMPAMRRIGWRWETGRCDVGHEHLATEAVRTWLGRIVAFAPQPRRLEPVLLACGPRDSHTLGIDALTALLTRADRQCRLLGARTPVASLVNATRTVEAAAVVITSHLSIGRRPAIEAIRAAAGSGVPVFYAGNAFIAAPTRQRLPATYLGDSIRDAARIIEAAIESPAGRG
jgi:MerR family transcriptional regulator, light-induced transcriptional regulator